jgi:hypothetical protein
VLLADRDFGSLDERGVAQRFEAKYIITEYEALMVRDYIEPYMNPDPHGREYWVNSLYLDSDDLMMCKSSELGEKNRHKLRLRWYEQDTTKPIIFEIKQRVDQVLRKRRTDVKREYMETILNGCQLSLEMLAKRKANPLADLYKFRDLMLAMNATPRAGVRYLREAYVSALEEPVRVTFDRNLACAPCFSKNPDDLPGGKDWRVMGEPPVVLEIKFTDCFPAWVRQLVRRVNLVRDSMAKYVLCVRALERQGYIMEGSGRREGVWTF